MTRTSILLAFVAALALAGCGGDDDKKKPFSGTGASSGTGGGGTGGGGTGGSSGDGGAGGIAGGGAGGVGGGGSGGGGTGGGGTGGGGGSGGGTIGPEQCNDGLDNDQNGKTDCADPVCTASCTSACAKPDVLPDPAVVSGSTAGHVDSVKNACSGAAGGIDVAYEFTAKHSGVFEAVLGGFSDLTLSVRSACNGTELGCTSGKSLKLPVTAGTKLWLVVDAASASSGGPFGLSAQSRAIACGDTHVDGTEACDDGNTKSGDGCSASCTVEAKETEPNNTSAQANTWETPFVASIGPAGDIDVVKVTITKANTTLSATISDLGGGLCDLEKVDSYLALWDSTESILAADDNSGDGLCSSLSKTGLAAGTYYLAVKAGPGASSATFAYKLNVFLN
ncbi:MAG: DVUA0089 family protein [Myxococcales bacterium]|nr:DVUA0089 family protein [Myxococcales bacterium]